MVNDALQVLDRLKDHLVETETYPWHDFVKNNLIQLLPSSGNIFTTEMSFHPIRVELTDSFKIKLNNPYLVCKLFNTRDNHILSISLDGDESVLIEEVGLGIFSYRLEFPEVKL